MTGVVKKWKKKTWINADILHEDIFYARTPDLERNFPPTVNSTFKIITNKNNQIYLCHISKLEFFLQRYKNKKFLIDPLFF